MTYWEHPEIPKDVNVWISPWNWKVIRPENFELGRQTDIGSYTVILAQQGVTIEDKVQVGPGVKILSISTIDGKQGKVTIKRNARVGANSVVMPGVTIGENAVVGALTFVNCDIPANETWVGTPAHKLTKSI